MRNLKPKFDRTNSSKNIDLLVVDGRKRDIKQAPKKDRKRNRMLSPKSNIKGTSKSTLKRIKSSAALNEKVMKNSRRN